MPKTGAPTKRDRKQSGQQQCHSQHTTHTHSSTRNSNRQSGARTQPSHSSKSHHHSEGFSAQEEIRRYCKECYERSGYFRRSAVQMKSDTRDVPSSAAQSSGHSTEMRGYWRTSPVQTRSSRRRHPPSAAQSRSDSTERTEEATTSKTGERHGNGRGKTDDSASNASRSQQHGTHHNARSSVKPPQHVHSATHSGGNGGTRVSGKTNATSVQHLDKTERRAPHRRSPIQTRSATHSSAQAASSLTKQSILPQPGAKAAQGKKNSKEQASGRGNTSAIKAGTSQGTAHSTSRSPRSSGRQYGKQGNNRTAVPNRGTSRQAERKTARKAGRGTATSSRQGTVQLGFRKSSKATAPTSVVTTQPTGKKRTSSQAFGSQGKQATTTVKEVKKQIKNPATAKTTKKQKIAAEPDCCAICLSELTTQPLAHPDVCRHVFCLDCLQSWQQRRKTCPIDNKPFQTLLPCSKDGKDIKIPVVKNNRNNRNGVVPVGNQPYNPIPAVQNRSEARNRRDHHNGQRYYVDPVDEGGWDDGSGHWDDDSGDLGDDNDSDSQQVDVGHNSPVYGNGTQHWDNDQGELHVLCIPSMDRVDDSEVGNDYQETSDDGQGSLDHTGYTDTDEGSQTEHSRDDNYEYSGYFERCDSSARRSDDYPSFGYLSSCYSITSSSDDY